MKKDQWSASLVCADVFNFQKQLQVLHESHVDYLHFDVMDGLFVPRFGMYPEMLHKVKEVTNIPVEVHLMIQNPEPYISAFAQAGARVITVHLETCQTNLARTLDLIHSHGIQAGVALNPATNFDEIEYVAEMVDYLLIMGINPGILGQKIKPFIISKVKKYKDLFLSKKIKTEIIVDGGVNFLNYLELFQSGADILVGGSQTIFHPSRRIQENISQLRCEVVR